MPAGAPEPLSIRRYETNDESEVLDLLRLSLGGGPGGERLPEFFRWKHLQNPFGPSFMLVAERDERIIGLRAFMRWTFHTKGDAVRAVRAVDTATHPDFQGQGVFSRLTRAALTALEEEADLVFNTPNSKSRPGYLKLGWQDVGRIPIRVRVRRPMRFALNLGGLRSDNASASAPAAGAVKAGEVLMAGDSELPRLLKESEVLDDRFRTHRSNEYLRWRYAEAPLLDYRAVTLEGDAGMRGLAFFRIRPRGRLAECTVSELIVRNDDFHAARSLLKLVSRAASIDHLTCSFPSGSAADRAARASGFIRVPKGMDLVVKPLQEVAPDPTSLDSWALSLGDLEVF